MKTGSIMMYGKASIPAGYLLCDGASYLRTDYPLLFSAIGTVFGSVDGSHFSVPSLIGTVIFGYKASDSDFGTLGQAGGAKTINIAHSHTMNTHTHTFSITTSTTSANNGDGNSNETLSAAGAHTHLFAGTTSSQSDAGSNSQLSATQSIMSKYLTLYPLIKI